jgi:hypothetical protein
MKPPMIAKQSYVFQNLCFGKIVTTRPSDITYLDTSDLSALDASVGNPFRYQLPATPSGAVDEQKQSCSR